MSKDVWENIDLSNNKVIGRENIPNKNKLIEDFRNAINGSRYNFKFWINKKKAPYQCVINNGIEDIDVLIYLKSISNAGWEDKPHCKRVQVSNSKLLPIELARTESKTKLNLIIGYYNYEKPIYASWDSSEYTRHKTNRSCYIDIEDMVQGYKNNYIELERSNRKVTIFKPEKIGFFLDKYIAKLDNSEGIEYNSIKNIGRWIADSIRKYNEILDYHWDGKTCVTEMKIEGSKNWRQMEWPGFYLEHQVEAKLSSMLNLFGVSHGKTKFDLFKGIAWDLKVHSLNSSSKNIITNDIEAINYAVEEFGYIGFIIVEGNSVWDENGIFKLWHDSLKGKKSKYVLEGEENKRPSRRRKVSFDIKDIKVVLMDKEDVLRQSSFQDGLLNSNGKKRNKKMLLDYNSLKEESIIYKI